MLTTLRPALLIASCFVGLGIQSQPARAESRLQRPAPGQTTIRATELRQDRVERRADSGEFSILGTHLEMQIAIAYGFHPLDLVFRTALPRKALFDVRARSADRRLDSAQQLLRDSLARHFGFEAQAIRRTTHVAVLRPLADWPPLEASSAATFVEQRPGRFVGRGVPIAKLISFVRSVAGQPVVDETGLSDRYDLVLEWDTRSEPYALVQAFEDIGLEMIFEKREVPFLVVRGAP